MAKKLNAAASQAAASDGPDAAATADELDILAGEQQGAIAGRIIAVREYGFFEAARILPRAEPMLAELQPMFEGREPPSMLAVMDVLVSHPDLIRHLLACAIAPPSGDATDHAAEVQRQEAWLETLNETDGEQMLLLWWQVNSSFFLRRLLRNAISKKASQSDSGASSPI